MPIVSALARSIPISLANCAAKYIAAADDHREIAAHLFDFFDFFREGFDGFRVDAKIQRTGKHFAGDFEDDPFVLQGPTVVSWTSAGWELGLFHRLPRQDDNRAKRRTWNIFTHSGDRLIDDIENLLSGSLINDCSQQANFGIETLHFTFDYFVDDLFRFAALQSLLPVNLLFLFASSAGTSSRPTYRGFAAATCMAMSFNRT